MGEEEGDTSIKPTEYAEKGCAVTSEEKKVCFDTLVCTDCAGKME